MTRRIALIALALAASAGAPGAQTPRPPAAGAAIDVSRFRHFRPVSAGDAGLVALPLDASVLADSAGPERGFADLRVVDPGGYEVPYLLEPLDEPLALDLTLERTTSAAADRMLSASGATGTERGHFTVYRIPLPHHPLPRARLVLTTGARVFSRDVMAGVERAADRRAREPWMEQLTAGRWMHTDPRSPASELVLWIPSVDAPAILIVVDEGNNTALPIDPPRLLLPAFRLRFYRNAGTILRLAYGRDDLAPPRYDLALLAPQVLTGSATEVAAGPETRPVATHADAVLASPWLLWTVLAVAVAVLLGFVVKLVRM